MPDNFDSSSGNRYSSFWPVLILIIGWIVWFGLQDYGLNNQRSAYATQLEDKQYQDVLDQAKKVRARYVALMNDLIQTAQKDPAAAQIVKDAIRAGLVHVQSGASNGAATPAQPASK